MRVGRTAGALGVAVLLVLAGCSGSDGDDADDTTTSTTDATPTTPIPTTGTTTQTAPTTETTSGGGGTVDPPSTDTTVAGLVPGEPCAPGSSPDCIDPEGSGDYVYLIGGAACMAGPLGGPMCTDLDGDGYAGYPDSG